MKKLLEGKVALVTGAAHGLGRCHALELARLGARVVVNDIGASADGSGSDQSAADAVVEEIRGAGGDAVAHFGDVADWNDAEAMVRRGVDEFGGLHVVVCNAGFIRDAVPWKMSEQEFDAVIRVHLKGHFCVMRNAMAHWREAAKTEGGSTYGRLITTSSESAIFGNPGQPNYSAAKAGIVALTMGAAQLMQKYGITANVLMPRARTRMNDSGPLAAIFQKPEQGFDNFAPENVSPLVGYLASPQAERISGHVFVVWAKNVTVLDRPSLGASFDSDTHWTVEDLHRQLGPHFEKLEPVKDGFIVPAV